MRTRCKPITEDRAACILIASQVSSASRFSETFPDHANISGAKHPNIGLVKRDSSITGKFCQEFSWTQRLVDSAPANFLTREGRYQPFTMGSGHITGADGNDPSVLKAF